MVIVPLMYGLLKIKFDIFTVGNLLNIFMEHGLNILMIFGMKEKSIIWPIQCIVGYCYKYTYTYITVENEME